LGDLLLTCSSPQSRNFSLGIALGRGASPSPGKLAEGQFTAPVLVELAEAKDIDMPVANAVAAILGGALTVNEAIEALMTRPFRAEG
jgi:glycerol-3-phosphate dehydrogenase (NAD(P)+)